MQIIPRWMAGIFLCKWIGEEKLLNENKKRTGNGVFNFLGGKSFSQIKLSVTTLQAGLSWVRILGVPWNSFLWFRCFISLYGWHFIFLLEFGKHEQINASLPPRSPLRAAHPTWLLSVLPTSAPEMRTLTALFYGCPENRQAPAECGLQNFNEHKASGSALHCAMRRVTSTYPGNTELIVRLLWGWVNWWDWTLAWDCLPPLTPPCLFVSMPRFLETSWTDALQNIGWRIRQCWFIFKLTFS